MSARLPIGVATRYRVPGMRPTKKAQLRAKEQRSIIGKGPGSAEAFEWKSKRVGTKQAVRYRLVITEGMEVFPTNRLFDCCRDRGDNRRRARRCSHRYNGSRTRR